MRKDSLKPIQMMTLTVGAIFGVDILYGPRAVASLAKQDAWISVLIGGILAIIIGSVYYFLASLYPDKDLPEIFVLVGGRFFGKILILLNSFNTMVYIALSLRIFAQALLMFLLDRTPIYVIVILMALVSAYSVYKGIYTISGVIDIIFPVCKLTIISVIILSLPQGDISALKPILFENFGNVLKGSMASYYIFTGFSTITYTYRYTENKKGTYKWYLAGLIIPLILFVGLKIATLMVFGQEDVKSLVFPTLTLTKSIEFTATFIERMESTAAILWIIIVYEAISMFLFISVRNINVLFNVPSDKSKYTVWLLLPIIIFTAVIIKSGLKVFEFFEYNRAVMMISGSAVVPVLTLLSYIKKKRSRNRI